MAKSGKHKVLYIILSVVLLLIAAVGGFAVWLSANYKQVLMKRIPAMVAKSTDSIYHISFRDIDLNIRKHTLTIYDAKFWPDTNQLKILRQQGRYAPNTLSTVSVPKVELLGLDWDKFISNKLITCTKIIAWHPDWYLETRKKHPDLSMVADAQSASLINRFTVDRFELVKPDFTYRYIGDNNNYTLYFKGGSAVVNDWAIDADINKDTSTILYGRRGSIRPDSLIFKKDGKDYFAESPVFDFVTGPNSVTLKDVKIKHFTTVEKQSKTIMEVYNFVFPSVELVDFNWKKLLHFDVLKASRLNVLDCKIGIHYIREVASATDKIKVGSFPNQLIHEAIKMDIRTVEMKNVKVKYTEPIKKSDSLFVIEFSHLNATFTNVTNIDKHIAVNKNCIVKMEGKYMDKSQVAATFNLSLADPKGHFTVDGYINNLEGDDVSKQASAFTFAKVTSFHLSHMTGHIEGDESYGKGDFTMLYDNLKISLFKFNTNDRKGKKGPFAFLADATILYPSNPMTGQDVRTATTSVSRDPKSGFIYLIWQNTYLAAQKTAVRYESIIPLAGGNTDKKEDPPKKVSLLKRLFGKKK